MKLRVSLCIWGSIGKVGVWERAGDRLFEEEFARCCGNRFAIGCGNI